VPSLTYFVGMSCGLDSTARGGIVHAAVMSNICTDVGADLILPLLVENWKRKDCFWDLQKRTPPSKLDPRIPMSLLLQAQTADYKYCCVQRLETESAETSTDTL